MLVVIEDIKSANDDILTQMDVSNKEFSEIVRIISDIAKKTNVINEIVFQTKLLSFNASVEAARAGKHGQAMGIIEINKEIGRLDKVTQQNLTTAQKSLTQAENLKIEANSLSHTVKKLVEFSNGSK